MDIIDIAIAKSKIGAVDPSDIYSAVSDYLDEHGVKIETDTTLSVAGASADSKAVGDALADASADVFVNTNATDVDLDIVDSNGNVLVRFANGHIKMKNFDSSQISE